MSQDAYIVLTVVSVLIVAVFFTSVFISFITKTITKSADVIVFVPSKEEDNDRITCGNALIAYDI